VTALEISGLVKSFPGSPDPTLGGFDLTVPPGSLTAILGPSGSGKTTVMKLIAGLLAPDAGDIRLGGRPILALPPERRGVVMVFQNPHLFPHLSVAENVGFGLRMRGVPAAEIAAKVDAMLQRVRLPGLGARRTTGLSGGQAQRVALARALVLQPDLLLLDEPLSSLDPGLRDEMRGLILTLQRDLGITTVVVTHDQTEALVLADRVAVLLGGKIAQHAPPPEVFQRPASAAVARFLGAMTLLPARLSGGTVHSALGALMPEHRPDLPDGAVTLCLRPEALQLGSEPGARPARVLARAFLGTQTRVTLDCGGTTLTALVSPDAAANLGDGQTVGLGIPASALWVVPAEG
jgi:ABC-type Fe3+/spermidine/putrescine transport system ATPase subunit